MTHTQQQHARYVYTDRDGTGRQDPAIRAYGSPFLDQTCERAGPWWRGKAIVRFRDGSLVVVRSRLLRKVAEPQHVCQGCQLRRADPTSDAVCTCCDLPTRAE